MIIGIVIPVHIYDFDIQGGLNSKEKLTMYRAVLKMTKKLYKNCKIILCGHGYHPGKKFDDYIDALVWSEKFQPPNKFGLFDNNPAQYKIVSLGCEKALKLGCSHIVKTRGDALIYNSALIKQDLFKKPNKIFITQQTSFDKNHLTLGDCFIYGPANIINGIFDRNQKKIYSQDGLINTAYLFMAYFEINKKDYLKALLKYCEFRDLSELKVYDYRWNFKKYLKNFIPKFQPSEKLLWGFKNNWIKYKNNKIIYMDRKIYFTRKLFYSIFFRITYRFIIKYEIYKRLNLLP